jgi:hypothetical protein
VHILILASALLFGLPLSIQSQSPKTIARATTPAVVITTEPNAIVWVDEIRRGKTDASGKLSLAKVLPGRHTVRVRASGFKESTTLLPPSQNTLTVKLMTTTDKAELLFQEAEAARDEARDEAAKE